LEGSIFLKSSRRAEIRRTSSAGQRRILLTFDKDFGELVFRRGLPAGIGVVLFRVTPRSPEEAADLALALVHSQPDLGGVFCVVTRDRVRIRRLR
jgi:predicted nuclease of predicted toxin-antitoxin system